MWLVWFCSTNVKYHRQAGGLNKAACLFSSSERETSPGEPVASIKQPAFFSSSERETPPGKPVASIKQPAFFSSNERETPPGKPVASIKQPAFLVSVNVIHHLGSRLHHKLELGIERSEQRTE